MGILKQLSIKQLASRKKQAEKRLNDLKVDAKELCEEQKKVNSYLSELGKEMASRTRSTPIVSEHAMLRFCERALGLDLEQLTSDVLPDEVIKQIEVMGDGKYPIGHGCKVVVENRVVVTVLGGEK